MDLSTIRKYFPVLEQQVHHKPLVYLDNAATTQKPQGVIDRVLKYYKEENSNIHRGIHMLSEQASVAFEQARSSVQQFINAHHHHEIIFTKGTTESINLLAFSFGEAYVGENDEIIVSEMEHHANIVPWQLLCQRKQATLKVVKIDDNGVLDMQHFTSLLSARTKMVSLAHVSNVLGTINPLESIIDLAHKVGAAVHIDGAQAVAHAAVDVQALDVDFYSFSGHKMYAPMGVGILYGKTAYLESMPPYQSGGEMIQEVSFQGSTFNTLPFKFEAGTPNVAAVLGLEAAIIFLQEQGLSNMQKHEHDLLAYATQKLKTIEGMRIIGEASHKSGVISFVLERTHPSDVAMILDQLGIAVRSGHHCAQPLMQRFDIPGTVRASFAVYNTYEDVQLLVSGILKAQQMLL